METKTRPWRHIYHDIEIPSPKSHDIEISRPKNLDIEKRRKLTHVIVIPRQFFRGQKPTTSRFQDQKAAASSSCGILTLMPPDRKTPCLSSVSSFCGVPLSSIPPLFRYSTVVPWCSGYSTGVPCSDIPALFRCSASVPCSAVPCSGVPGFIVCHLKALNERISEWAYILNLTKRFRKYLNFSTLKKGLFSDKI